MKKTVVGLTGGIACGKSVAADILRSAGAYIIDTDVISREIINDADVREKMRAAFPQAYNGLELDRAKLRELVFSDGEKLKILKAITHPPIAERTREYIEKSDEPITVVVAPLLYEAGFDRFTSYDIAVVCDEEVRIERLKKRDAISEETARRMSKSQLADAERAGRADCVIYNNGTLAQFRANVLRIYYELSDPAGR